MKNWFFGSFLVATMVVFIQGCGVLKKDEGGSVAAVPCPPEHVMSSYYGRCVAQGSCPRGYVVNINQPSTCVNPSTGENAMPQQCAAGYVLTVHGCLAPGPCNPGQGLYGGVTCVNGISGAGGFSGLPQMYGNGGMTPYYGSGYGYSPYTRYY